MTKDVPSGPELLEEKAKQKREKRFAVILALVFLFSTFLQAFLTERKQDFGFIQSLLYFGLIHLNVILIMFLVFLISRNLIKAYLHRKTGQLGSSLRWKLVTSLLAFSIIPSLLLFAGSSLVIRQGFERWFGGQVSKALEDAQAITDVHYKGIERNLFHFAEIAKKEIATDWNQSRFKQENLDRLFKTYALEGIEIYPDFVSLPFRSIDSNTDSFTVPRAAYESLERAFSGEEFVLIRQFGDGDLVQRFVNFSSTSTRNEFQNKVVVVVTQIVPLGLKTRIADLKSSFTGYQNTLKFKDSLKGQYTLVLLTLFVLTLFVVSWFGLLIAKGVTEPVGALMLATEAFREGKWSYRIPVETQSSGKSSAASSFSNDLVVLQQAFNTMAEEVGFRGKRLEEANAQLISLVRELEDRERYLEILLSAIRRGVLVLDTARKITRINTEAFELSPLFAESPSTLANLQGLLGLSWEKVFSNFGDVAEINSWLDETRTSSSQPHDRVLEVQTGPKTQQVLRSIRATGISLQDEKSRPLGWLIILEDISDASRLEKLAAWQEVARRVAHEIKNPLTPIQISADRMYRKMPQLLESNQELGEIFSECLSQVQKQVRVIRDLVKEFSQFAKLPEPKFESLEMSSFIKSVLADYSFHHPESHFEFENKLSGVDDRAWIKADPEYMRRLIVNLADNSLQIFESHNQRPRLVFKVSLADAPGQDGFYEIQFRDNGPGVSPSVRERIFDPYVTSRASGLGLGLPIVRKIAQEHSGRIRCEESNDGACFVLEIPKLKIQTEEKVRVENRFNR
jgi:two-component system nitrogen regulation sensor histidine kinase NtrY